MTYDRNLGMTERPDGSFYVRDNDHGYGVIEPRGDGWVTSTFPGQFFDDRHALMSKMGA